MLRRRILLLATALATATAGLAATPPAHASGARIYLLGDSITYGSTWGTGLPVAPPAPVPGGVGFSTPGGYRGFLDALLTASTVDHEFLGSGTDNSTPVLDQEGQAHHDGHPGYRIEQDADNLDGRTFTGGDNGGYWLTGRPGRAPLYPDITLIHLGTNDIGQAWDPGTVYPGGRVNYADPAQRATFVAHMTARLEALVDKVLTLRPGTRIVLSNLIPIAVATYDVVVAEYNTSIAALVARERAAGARIVLADAWSLFAQVAPTGAIVVTPGLLSPDNVHPTPAGYALMAGVYRDAILRVGAL